MSKLLNKTLQEAAADLEATNNLARSLLEAFKSSVRGFLPGMTITKKKPLKIEVERQQLQPKTKEIGTRKTPDDDSHSEEKLHQRGIIYGLGINKLTEADLLAIATIVNGKKGTKIVGSDDYIIRHNGKIVFETTMGEVTTHTRLSNELRDRIVGLKTGISPSPTSTPIPNKQSPSPTSAPAPNKSTKSDRAPSNFAAEIKDFATKNSSFVSPEEAKNYMNTYRQLKSGIVPEPNFNLSQPLEKSDPAGVDSPEERLRQRSPIASEFDPDIPHYGRDTNNDRLESSIPGSEKTGLDRSQTVKNSAVAEVIEAQELSPANEQDLKIVRFLFNLFGRNTNKENHNTNNGREGILELPTGAKLINRIEASMAYLSLMRDGIVYEIGSYDRASQEHAVRLGLVDIQAELADLKPYIDPQTLTIAEHNRNSVKPEQERDRPAPQSLPNPVLQRIAKPVTKQHHAQIDCITFMNIEAEENLIAKILTDPNALKRVSEWRISDRSFDFLQYQQIFNSARSIADRGEEVNLLSVGDAMQDKHPGINSSLVTILSRDNPSVSLNSVTSIVRNNQIGRELLQVGLDLKVAAYDRYQPIFQITRDNLGAIADIQNGSDRLVLPTSIAPLQIVDLSDRRSEEQIITAILQVPQVTGYLTKTGLTGDCFTHPEHREIYTAAQDLDRHQEEVNLLSVRNRLKQNEAATTASNIVASTLVLPIDIHVGRVIELNQRRELLNVADTLERVKPRSSTEDLVNVLAEVKTAIEQTAAKSLKLPQLKIEESQPEPESFLDRQPSRGK
jgi:DnaB-like helicase N terminal domain